MSKIICDVCGTAYPEASTQCPICGCVRPANTQGIPSESNEAVPERTYQHVKGGRFSKANVRKRTSGNQSVVHAKTEKPAPVQPSHKKKKKSNGNMGLLITIFVLLLAIIAVVAYILIKFFIPAPADKPVEDPVFVEEPSEIIEEPVGDIYCQDLVLDAYELHLDNAGDYVYLTAMPEPFDTTEEVIFESADSAIAMVDSDGRITAVSKGETVITVSCGIVSAQCNVYVAIPQIVFELDQYEVLFGAVGETARIYSGEIPTDNIIWSSDDISVADVTGGVVTCIGNGTTTVYAEYNGEIQSCIIRCEIPVIPEESMSPSEDPALVTPEPGETSPTEPTQTEPSQTDPTETEAPASDYVAPYKLKNLIGPNSQEVSLYIGESFSLALVDANGTHIEGVSWSVEGSCCTVSDGTVKAVRSGNCVVVATYGGESYKCNIIVW